MILNIFILAGTQMIILFIFLAVGYLLEKNKMTGEAFGKVLSMLLLTVFIPALQIKTFAANFHRENLREDAPFFLIAIIMIVCTYYFSKYIAGLISKDKYERELYVYAFTFPNYGYMGYPIVLAVFGEKALFNMMMFAIPFSFFIYTLGLHILDPARKWSWKCLVRPTTFSMFIGLTLGLADFRMPKILNDVLVSASNCMAPTALILTGSVIARQSIKEMFRCRKTYIVSAVKLILIPVITGGILYALGIRGQYLIIPVIVALMPIGMNTVIFPENFGGDSMTGAKACLVSNVLSLLTIPVGIALITFLAIGR